ncbi:cysteine synthase A [Marininema mesophilum]|uniref:Cysteine synthase A n=1 Tax=Marininema mesophilum TaxID=1048340 RepID=A0A1H2YUX8_9BACL|nr:cysteine synthase family protein [Marininema mesophilum]SDX08865.1 cysteine synthase A [Marininema mesophilum]
MLNDRIIDSIGNTPLIHLALNKHSKANGFAKLEMMNPFGMKDRVAKRTILRAKESGVLKDGMPIVESSSGTLALGVTLVGTYLGHEVHIVTDPRIDLLTLTKLQALGAHVHIVEHMSKGGWQSARLEYLFQFLKENPDAFWLRQYENPENPASYIELAQELITDLERVDVLVGAVGSGGSLGGTARELKKYFPNLKVLAVDAVGSAIFNQEDYPKRLQGGLGNSLIPSNVDFEVIDEVHWLNDSEAFGWTLELARNEKLFTGNSSGSVYAVMRWLGDQLPNGTNVVGIFPDRGDRYIQTLFNGDYREKQGLVPVDVSAKPIKVQYRTHVKSWSYSTLEKDQVLSGVYQEEGCEFGE